MRDSTGTETDLAATGTLYNFLTNPGFEIWQRGTGAFTANGAYTADDCGITLIGTDTISVTRSGTGDTDTVKDSGGRYALKAVFTLGTGAGGTYIQKLLRQNTNIDYSDGLLGQVISASVRVRANAANAVRIAISTDGTGGIENYSSYHSGGGTFETLTVTNITVPSDATTVRVRLYFAATVTAYFDNATLVLGSVAQTYYPLHPAEEWERCQRYYEVHGGSVNGMGIRGYANAATDIAATVPFAVRKAVIPTMTKSGTWFVANASQPTANNPDIASWSIDLVASAAGMCQTSTNSADDTITAEANP